METGSPEKNKTLFEKLKEIHERGSSQKRFVETPKRTTKVLKFLRKTKLLVCGYRLNKTNKMCFPG